MDPSKALNPERPYKRTRSQSRSPSPKPEEIRESDRKKAKTVVGSSSQTSALNPERPSTSTRSQSRSPSPKIEDPMTVILQCRKSKSTTDENITESLVKSSVMIGGDLCSFNAVVRSPEATINLLKDRFPEFSGASRDEDQEDIVLFVFGPSGTGKTTSLFGGKTESTYFKGFAYMIFGDVQDEMIETTILEVNSHKTKDLVSNDDIRGSAFRLQTSLKTTNRANLANCLQNRIVEESGKNTYSSRSAVVVTMIHPESRQKVWLIDLPGQEPAYSVRQRNEKTAGEEKALRDFLHHIAHFVINEDGSSNIYGVNILKSLLREIPKKNWCLTVTLETPLSGDNVRSVSQFLKDIRRSKRCAKELPKKKLTKEQMLKAEVKELNKKVMELEKNLKLEREKQRPEEVQSSESGAQQEQPGLIVPVIIFTPEDEEEEVRLDDQGDGTGMTATSGNDDGDDNNDSDSSQDSTEDSEDSIEGSSEDFEKAMTVSVEQPSACRVLRSNSRLSPEPSSLPERPPRCRSKSPKPEEIEAIHTQYPLKRIKEGGRERREKKIKKLGMRWNVELLKNPIIKSKKRSIECVRVCESGDPHDLILQIPWRKVMSVKKSTARCKVCNPEVKEYKQKTEFILYHIWALYGGRLKCPLCPESEIPYECTSLLWMKNHLEKTHG